jgi:predicted RNA binding protein YcfA (HicA-like mRNA interferase family)
MNPIDIRHFLEQDGWGVIEDNGKYLIFKHPVKLGKIAVPYSDDELPPATLDAILKKAGLKR